VLLHEGTVYPLTNRLRNISCAVSLLLQVKRNLLTADTSSTDGIAEQLRLRRVISDMSESEIPDSLSFNFPVQMLFLHKLCHE
jgi:hypothetical protein